MILLLFVLLYPSDTRQENHRLLYMFSTLTSKAQSFPWFTAVSFYDDRLIAYYSNEHQKWIETLTIDKPPESRDWFLHYLNTLSNCTGAQCSELHVLQRITGCELERFPNRTESLRAFDEYGFDGEDFITFNYDALRWIDKNPKAKETKINWDQQTLRKQVLQQFLENCMNWISTFNNTKINSPDVRVIVRKYAFDPSKLVLICLVTGFYPRDIKMNIRLNRINIENQISSEVRPNEDESFQMRTSVEIYRNHEGSYDCHVIHSSLTEPITVEWDGTCINCETVYPWLVIAGAAAVLFLVLTVIGYCIYKKKRTNVLMYMYEEGRHFSAGLL